MKKLVAIATFVVMAFVSFLSLQGGSWFNAAKATADCATMAMDAREAQSRGDMTLMAYRTQEAQACWGTDLDKSKKPVGGDQSPTASPSSSISATPNPSGEPSASPTPMAAPTAQAVPAARRWEYLANRPAEQKTGVNSFGPKHGLKVDKDLNDMNRDEALSEFRHRLSIDPMLTAATGAAFKLWPYAEVDANTKLFAEDHGAWDRANADIERTLDEALKADEIEIVKLSGVYTGSYSIPGGVPSVRTDMDVSRNGQTALKIKSKLFQTWCGFQEYLKQLSQGKSAAPVDSKPMPVAAPGMARNSEGTPVKERPAKPVKPKESPVKPTGPPSTTTPAKPPTSKPPTSKPPTTQPPTSKPPTSKPPTTQPPTLNPKNTDEDVNKNQKVDDYKKSTDGSAKTNRNDGSKDSQGLQTNPGADATKAAEKAQQSQEQSKKEHQQAKDKATTSGGGRVDNNQTNTQATKPSW